LSPLTPVLPLCLCGSFSTQEHTNKISRLLFALERPFGRSPLASSIFCRPVHEAISVCFLLRRGCRSRTRFSPSVSLQLCFSLCSCPSAPRVGSGHLRFSLPAGAAVFVSILWFRQISAAQGFSSRVSFEPVDQLVFFVLCLLVLGLKVHCRSVLIHLQSPCHP
jgi:hypothetical protein